MLWNLHLTLSIDGAYTLMLYDMRTHRQSELARGTLGFWTWSRDSQYVYFDTGGDDAAFRRVRIRDGNMELMASLRDLRRTAGSMSAWSGLAPDGSLLVERDAGTSEIYALDWHAP